MILLDTNVVSEAIKLVPDAAVKDWLDAQAAETLFLSSISVAELLYGVAALPGGARKEKLSIAIDHALAIFGSQILLFDAKAARKFAMLAANAKAAGYGFPMLDAYIAAIAASNGFAIAARDATAFTAAGLNVINPWNGI